MSRIAEKMMNGIAMEKLNRDLILRTKKTVVSKDFINYAKDDPTLGRLHPLARAFASIFYTIPGLSEEGVRELRRRGLNTCWLSGKVQADREYHLAEDVHHVLEKKIGKLKLLLEFSSRGDTYFCGRGAYLEVRPQLFYTPLCLNRLDKEFAGTSSELLIDYWKKYANAGPVSYPEDSGSQIGGYQINLTKISGVSVEGPTLSNNGVETEWNLLAEGADSDIDDHDQPDSFCPFHYMTLDQAIAIGIVANLQVPSKIENTEQSPEYPYWLPESLRKKQYWITENDLDASFSNGVVIPEMLHFYIGPNEQWSPEYASAKPIYSSRIISGSKSNAIVTDLIQLLAELVA